MISNGILLKKVITPFRIEYIYVFKILILLLSIIILELKLFIIKFKMNKYFKQNLKIKNNLLLSSICIFQKIFVVLSKNLC